MIDVVLFQYRLLHYRMALYDGLRNACRERGINLHLVCGQASRREQTKRDEGTLPWAEMVCNRFWEVGSRDIVWQPYPSHLRSAALVIVMQENRILSNYPLLLSRLFCKRKVAYWGHGVNFQSGTPNGLREQWKRLMLTRVDWWFAYTQMTKSIVKERGYPDDRITVLDNAIDNNSFRSELASITDVDLRQIKRELQLPENGSIGLFCGSLYVDKRLDLMIAAADRIRQKIPDFVLIVVGDGPDADKLHTATRTRPWLHCVGVKKGRDKAAYFRLASVIFNPGAVGLHVLDAFCAGIPMATTRDARHGPEIAYLFHGVNGINTDGTVEAYADAVIALLEDQNYYRDIGEAALRSADHYTLDNMVKQFADGIEQCLRMPKKP